MPVLLAASAIAAFCVGLAMWTSDRVQSKPAVADLSATTGADSAIVSAEGVDQFPQQPPIMLTHGNDRAAIRAPAAPPGGASRALLPIPLTAGVVILGSVSDSAGHPIPDASIVMAGPRRSRVAEWQHSRGEWSDDDGCFAMSEVQDGTYDIRCRADGYFGYAQAVVEVTAGVAQDVRLVLELGIRYAGRVVAADGEGIEGATMRLVVSVDVGGTQSESTAWTDRHGNFEMQGVPEGAAVLFACEGGESGLLPREIRAASIAELPSEIVLARGATIEIVLQAPAGVRLPESAIVSLHREGAAAAGAERFSSSSSHRIEHDRVRVAGLESGTYTARLFVVGFKPAVATGVAVEQYRTNTVSMTLGEPGRSATIVVMGPSHEALAGARVVGTLRDRHPGSPGPPVALGICDQRGEWHLLIPDGFVVGLTIEADGFAAMRTSDFDIEQQGVRWEFMLEPAALLRVIVRDETGQGDPTVQASLELVPPSAHAPQAPIQSRSRRLVSAASQFQFEALASGTYRLRLRRAGIEIHSSEIVLAIGESKAVEVAVPSGLVVHGVVAVNGDPVDGGTLHLISGSRVASVKVDRSGAYRMTVAESGAFTAQYRSPGGCTLQEGPFEIVGPFELPLDFRAVSFEGEVLLPDGNPASGVRWSLQAEGGFKDYAGRTDAAGRLVLGAVSPAHYFWRVDAPAGFAAPELDLALLADTSASLTLECTARLHILLDGEVNPLVPAITVLRERAGPEPADIIARPRVAGDPLIVSWAAGARFGYARSGSMARIFEVPAGADVVALSLDPCGTLLARLLPRLASPGERRSVTIEWLERGVPLRITTAWGDDERHVSLELPPGEYQARSLAASGEYRTTRFTIAAGDEAEIDLE